MKIKISRKQIVSRAVACFVALAVVVGAVAQLPRHAEAADRLNKVYQFKDTNYAVPTSKVLWVESALSGLQCTSTIMPSAQKARR